MNIIMPNAYWVNKKPQATFSRPSTFLQRHSTHNHNRLRLKLVRRDALQRLFQILAEPTPQPRGIR